ncbi:hypothetical protein [Paenibacillus paridis]|uniref:hypothetical protein n=1 Tax=Paenibacillus paridis TaxID=2583376 RepID=UPI00111ED450|nr:hypothetical protein [Paenibacillus paridis]
MEDSKSKSSCQIQRVARMVSLNENSASLEINGQYVNVPINKIAVEALPGDFVIWTGQSWCPIPKEH